MQLPYKYTVSGAVSAPGTASFLVFSLDDRRYGVAIESVERVVRAFSPAPLPKGPASVLGLLNIHGRVIPLLNIRHIFSLPERELMPRDYFIITTGPSGARAIAGDSVPMLTACRPDELIPADAVVRGEYVDRVIKAKEGLVLIFDPRRLPPREKIDGAGAHGGTR